MTPLCIREGDITSDHLKILRFVQTLLEIWSDDGPHKITCHSVCSQIASFSDEVIHYRGKFNGTDHSWLIMNDNPKVILDPYPWACGSGPILITTEGILNPWRTLYVGEPV